MAVFALLLSVTLFWGLGRFNRLEADRALARLAVIDKMPLPVMAPVRDPGGEGELGGEGRPFPSLINGVPENVFTVERTSGELHSALASEPIVLEPGGDIRIARSEDFVYELEDLDTVPIPLVQVKPVYPERLKRAHIESNVTAIVSIDQDGDVFDVEIEHSEYSEFSESVIMAVLMWKFIPGQKDGSRVKQRVRLPVTFRLRTDGSVSAGPGETVGNYVGANVRL